MSEWGGALVPAQQASESHGRSDGGDHVVFGVDGGRFGWSVARAVWRLVYWAESIGPEQDGTKGDSDEPRDEQRIGE